MKSALSLGIAVFILGAALGSLGYKVWLDRTAPLAVEPTTTTVDHSQQTVSVAEQGLQLTIRQTDALARIKGDADAIIGVRIFDTWSGDPNTATSFVDLIWERQKTLFDQPDAKDLDAYRKPTTAGLTITQSKELTIDGRPAIKQLYSIEVEVPGPLGSTSKQVVPNQLRYVIQDKDRFLVLRATANYQTFLDTIAQSLKFVTASTVPSSSSQGIPLDLTQPSSGQPISSPSPVTGADGKVDLQAQ